MNYGPWFIGYIGILFNILAAFLFFSPKVFLNAFEAIPAASDTDSRRTSQLALRASNRCAVVAVVIFYRAAALILQE